MSIAERAKAAFDAYAGMAPPDLPADPWSALQVRLYRWEVRNFGWQPAHRHLLGITEEVGEYYAADSIDERDDAIADVSIFAIQLATSWRLDWGELFRAAPEYFDSNLPEIAGRIAHVQLKHEQKIRGMGDPGRARAAIAIPLSALFGHLCTMVGCPEPYFVLVSRVAESVMAREPKKLPAVVR